MAEHSTIEWTDATWNPITGCTLVDEGCRNCYAATLAATRLKNHPSRAGLARVNAAGDAKFTGEVRFNEEWLDQPLRWSRPRMIFVCAHGDLFHESVPDEWIDRVFAIMVLATRHTFQVLTKRPDRAARYMNASPVQCLPNVWLGTSVHDQASADARIPHLMQAPAAVRFLSYEPALGPVTLPRFGRMNMTVGPDWPMSLSRSGVRAHAGQVYRMDRNPYGARSVVLSDGAPLGLKPHEVTDLDLDWVIMGGESGPRARPMHPAWARSMRDQCAAAGVPFFFKQWGEWLPDQQSENPGPYATAPFAHAFDDFTITSRVGKKAAGRALDGVIHNGMPRGAK